MKKASLATRSKRTSALIVLPLALFVFVFVALPFVHLLITSVSYRGGEAGFTLENYKRILEPIYRTVYLDSLKLAVITTISVIALGYPFGYFMARLNKNSQQRVNSLLLIPFSLSSLLRLYGWDIMFRADGPINKVLLAIGLIQEPLKLKYTYGATIAGMIYALLPFMIFSVYSSAEKLDWTLVEASRDLGASPFYAFRTISFPLILPGLLSGVILTFIPSMGLIFIAEILGGNKVVLVGNLIEQEATQGKNVPFAAALSVILMIMTSLFIYLYRKVFKMEDLEGLV